MSGASLPAEGTSIAEQVATTLCEVQPRTLPAAVHRVAARDLLDVAGLCLAARNQGYVKAVLEAFGEAGACTAIGHNGAFSAGAAAAVNGTAAHGEDYDDTLEGTPNHVGAVVIPAVLAVCEAEQRSGQDALRGIVGGMELMSRMVQVVPGGFHKACFHPTAITGTFGATMGAGLAMGLTPAQLVNALGIGGSLCSGIIEYLAEGTWTKRLHAGWAAQSGIRACQLARGGFTGPRTVFEGEHSVFRAFSPAVAPDLAVLTESLGERWVIEGIAFKLYACGTMIHPYIDCMVKLASQGVRAEDIVSIECRTAEAIVHRLWEPLAAKHAPANGYAAKFSIPYSMAVGFFDGRAGFEQYTDERVADQAVLDLAAKVNYVIDPEDPYPMSYTGDARVSLRNGDVITVEQPHFRGGMHEPLSDEELTAKFEDNCRYGGLSAKETATAYALCERLLGSEDALSLASLRW